MLLPIVFLLASAGPVQQVKNVADAAEQFAISQQNQAITSDPATNKFVNPGRNGTAPHKPYLDQGIIIPKNPCIDEGTCRTACLSITAYVFSDGENPKLQYVTHCPNLDVPYQTKRAQHNGTNTRQEPGLKRTSF